LVIFEINLFFTQAACRKRFVRVRMHSCTNAFVYECNKDNFLILFIAFGGSQSWAASIG